MASTVAILSPAFGASELKRVERRDMAWAVGLASLVHLLLAGVWWISEHTGGEEPPSRTVRVLKYSELGPPPSISSANAPAAVAIALPKAPVKPRVAIPMPVPDEKVSPEVTIPTQEELAVPVADAGAPVGDGTAIESDLAVGNIQDDAPPPDFVPFEKEPQVVRRIEPVYPEAAKQSGIEGAVFAKLWIDKEGKVKDVVILKSPSDLFRQAVIDAARQWVFTPAVMNSGAVAVWFPVKFTFNLKS